MWLCFELFFVCFLPYFKLNISGLLFKHLKTSSSTLKTVMCHDNRSNHQLQHMYETAGATSLISSPCFLFYLLKCLYSSFRCEYSSVLPHTWPFLSACGGTMLTAKHLLWYRDTRGWSPSLCDSCCWCLWFLACTFKEHVMQNISGSHLYTSEHRFISTIGCL